MNKLAAVMVLALVGAVALPTIDASAQTSAPSSSSAKKAPCSKFTSGTPEYQNCMDRRAKNAQTKRDRQAACAQYKPKTQERKDCMAQQKQRTSKTSTRSG